MKYRIGQKLYTAYCLLEDNGRMTGGTYEHEVRTIRGGKVTAIQKVKHVTWIKKSSKHFDYGWATGIDAMYRKTFPVDGPATAYTTKRQAWASVIRGLKAMKSVATRMGRERDISRELAYCRAKMK